MLCRCGGAELGLDGGYGFLRIVAAALLLGRFVGDADVGGVDAACRGAALAGAVFSIAYCLVGLDRVEAACRDGVALGVCDRLALCVGLDGAALGGGVFAQAQVGVLSVVFSYAKAFSFVP